MIYFLTLRNMLSERINEHLAFSVKQKCKQNIPDHFKLNERNIVPFNNTKCIFHRSLTQI